MQPIRSEWPGKLCFLVYFVLVRIGIHPVSLSSELQLTSGLSHDPEQRCSCPGLIGSGPSQMSDPWQNNIEGHAKELEQYEKRPIKKSNLGMYLMNLAAHYVTMTVKTVGSRGEKYKIIKWRNYFRERWCTWPL